MAERSSGETGRAVGSLHKQHHDASKTNENEIKNEPKTASEGGPPPGPEYPSPSKRAIIMISLYLAMFLVILVSLHPRKAPPEFPK